MENPGEINGGAGDAIPASMAVAISVRMPPSRSMPTCDIIYACRNHQRISVSVLNPVQAWTFSQQFVNHDTASEVMGLCARQTRSSECQTAHCCLSAHFREVPCAVLRQIGHTRKRGICKVVYASPAPG